MSMETIEQLQSREKILCHLANPIVRCPNCEATQVIKSLRKIKCNNCKSDFEIYPKKKHSRIISTNMQFFWQWKNLHEYLKERKLIHTSGRIPQGELVANHQSPKTSRPQFTNGINPKIEIKRPLTVARNPGDAYSAAHRAAVDITLDTLR